MAIVSNSENGALSQASGNAAIDQALALLKTDKEAVRAAHWNRLDERTRKMICHMAGIGADKGAGSLRNMDALERGKVNRAAARLIRDMEVLMRCAQGGDMPKAWGSVQ
ncbi:hypothetical protein CAter10_2525 [Collimonas arenae]|uniref:hypothetical protein n=1 Tax=Collimonas arenae TaxID=279058 RepID=UPI0007787B1A|nr:hypothetical protein [Collimonas arenae]AMP00171.1 hypothetical protein CAter10_2525 [Collimonas arenae]